ncbi:MAG: alpha/beta hydrolase family protein [Pseudohaliea sp.]
MKRLLLAILFLPALAVGGLLALNNPEPLPPASDSARRLADGPLPIARLPLELADRSRPTDANGDFPGSPVRQLKGHLWYPAEGGPYPLLVYSHGFTSDHRNGAYLAEHLASHGFVVAAVNHPLTHWGAPGGPRVADVVNQPGDMSFLIDRLLARSADAGDVLAAAIDGGRIGALGVSLGGLTATLAGFHPTFGDPRIDAVLSIAGPSSFFTSRFFAGDETAFLMLAARADVLVPWEANARPIPAKVPGGELVTLARGSHTGFAGGTRWLRWMNNPDALGCWAVKRNIENGEEEDWGQLLGTEAQGIDLSAAVDLCAVDPLPPAMNVLRQQALTRLVARAFFERSLAVLPATRAAADRFLGETLPAELPELSYAIRP